MSTKQIHSNHRYRMRKRFLDNKASGFYPHELIEMLLYYPIPRRDTNPTAHELLDKFGGIEKLLSAEVSELRSCERIGDTTACFLAAASEICRRSVEYRSVACEDDPDSLLVKYIRNNFLGEKEDICFIISVTPMLGINNSQVIPLSKFINKKIAYSMIAHAIINNNCDRVVLGAYYPNARFVETNKKRDLMVISSEIKRSIGTDIVDTIVCSKDRILSLSNMREIAELKQI